jgi:hypothetical protein
VISHLAPVLLLTPYWRFRLPRHRIRHSGRIPELLRAKNPPKGNNLCGLHVQYDSAVSIDAPTYGWDDLDAYGDWGDFPGYGYGWAPYEPFGWSPYGLGMWSWYPGWGYTWISGEPWGWLPFHYGMWNYDASEVVFPGGPGGALISGDGRLLSVSAGSGPHGGALTGRPGAGGSVRSASLGRAAAPGGIPRAAGFEHGPAAAPSSVVMGRTVSPDSVLAHHSFFERAFGGDARPARVPLGETLGRRAPTVSDARGNLMPRSFSFAAPARGGFRGPARMGGLAFSRSSGGFARGGGFGGGSVGMARSGGVSGGFSGGGLGGGFHGGGMAAGGGGHR